MASFAKVLPFIGFDPAVPWLMVGLNNIVFVKLVGAPKHTLTQSGDGADAGMISVEKDEVKPDGSRILQIKGTRAGKLELAAEGSPAKVALQIDVFEPANISVRFYRLSDDAGHHTTRECASMPDVLADATFIHFMQDNIMLDLDGCQDLKLSGDQKAIPKSGDIRSVLNDLFRAKTVERCRASFHVFLIWNYQSDEGEKDKLGTTFDGTNFCIIKDFLQPKAGSVLAHELGHFFLFPTLSSGDLHHHASRENLMFKFAAGGEKLTRDQAETMHDNVNRGRTLNAQCEVPVPEGL